MLHFLLSFFVSFEADATEGLSYMHGLGIVHCDHKLENTLICKSDGPTGFVGKVTDPGLWCGESGGREGASFGGGRGKCKFRKKEDKKKQLLLLRGAVVNKTYGTHEKKVPVCISLFLITIFGLIYYGGPP